jgi:ribosomal protein S18 acetylase RimI-like enzyme
VAVLPWDADIFGFPVADLQLGDISAIASDLQSFKRSLAAWTSGNRVELVSCYIPADQPALRALLPETGFVYVDTVLRAALVMDGPWTPAQVDFAQRDDQADLERIAETAIQFGRYHADARFPRHLADRRYRIWVRNALAAQGAETAIYVIRRSGRAVAFSHVEFEEGKAHAALTAVDPGYQRGGIGKELINMRLNDLAVRGIRETYSRISVINASILNFYAAIGFRFSMPMAVYHWHSPQASHLVSWDALFKQQDEKATS